MELQNHEKLCSIKYYWTTKLEVFKLHKGCHNVWCDSNINNNITKTKSLKYYI